LSTENIYAKVLEVADRHQARHPFQTHLDVGAGTGRLVQLFRDRFKTRTSACDYTDKLIKVPGQKIDIVDLNRQPFPYPDATFDIVTMTEVVEHLERYREVLRDLFRITKPGGTVILTTPNILNLNSRLRNLWFGYAVLFGPLPVRNSALYSTGGHINPVSYFYLAHSLIDAGFDSVKPDVDRYQRSGIAKLIFWWLPIRFFGWQSWRKEVNRYHTLDGENAPLVRAMNTHDMLLGRTIIVSAIKPG
jgi:ubiquinone/menaquinone biosynthesis C-methylase UbiE